MTSLTRLFKMFWPYGRQSRVKVAAMVGLTLVRPLLRCAVILIVKVLIDSTLVQGQLTALPAYVLAYLAVAVLMAIVEFAATCLDARITEGIAQRIRVGLYGHLLSLSPGSLRKSTGDLLNHFSGDVSRCEYLIYSGPLGVISNALNALTFVAVLCLLSWQLTLCALLLSPLFALVSLRAASQMRRAARNARKSTGRWMSLAGERLDAAPLVHIFDTHDAEIRALDHRCTRARRAELSMVYIQARLGFVVELIGMAAAMAIFCLGAFEIYRHALTLGDFIAFLGSAGSLYGPIRSLGKSSGRFHRAAAGAQRIADLLNVHSLVRGRQDAAPALPAKGAIELRNVRFGHEGTLEIVRGVSLRVEAGETIAIVGTSGAGKTTLLRLFLRLCDPTSGAITLDGQDIRALGLSELRRSFAAVLQDTQLFDGSIADNIRYGSPLATSGDLLRVSRAAHVDSFVQTIPGGYSSSVGLHGAKLSGGQKQRIALARALIRQAPVLLLDEATSALDGLTEELVQDAISERLGRATTIIVAHRLSSVRYADRLIVMEDGQFVEIGTPNELLSRPSRARALFSSQFTKAAA